MGKQIVYKKELLPVTDQLVQLKGVCKQFSKAQTAALENITLNLERGQILALLGPSGCGKTTLLRSIAGFEQPDSGTISLAGRKVAAPSTYVPPEKRRVGMVFQEFALFPHLSVGDNVAFGLKQKIKQPALIKAEVLEAIALVGLEGLQDRYPHELSGGQRQRVALARALAPRPVLMLLDEPLSNLDLQVRIYLRNEIRKILKETETTAIFVTHDREEALAISDVVGVMHNGRLEQLDTPEEVYQEPTSRFVAGFVTQANFLWAKRNGRLWETEVGCFEAPTANSPSGETGEVMIREEDLVIQVDDSGTATVRDRQFLGRENRYCLLTPSGQEIHARTPISASLPVGARVQLSVMPERLKVFTS
ncbi:MAG: ABC transporter ATP-binding protein [Cyanobacteriota bacterium]|nr:ABC transporter ATP-binding protein [Cyanobacteriota bacterium]